jgi:heme-degrading monooxygenase HmoA
MPPPGSRSGTLRTVILETATFAIGPGESEGFEAAFAEAKTVIAAARGFRDATLHRSIEDPGRYVLLVRWDTLEDHTEGFRGSAAFQEWARILGRYRDGLVVEHLRTVVEVPAPG